MSKQKGKPKAAKEPGQSRGQVVRLKPAKPRASWLRKLPSPVRMWTTSAQFVGEAWAELKKVTWPGRKETLGTTLVVIFLVVVVAIYLGLVDYALSRIVRGVIR